MTLWLSIADALWRQKVPVTAAVLELLAVLIALLTDLVWLAAIYVLIAVVMSVCLSPVRGAKNSPTAS